MSQEDSFVDSSPANSPADDSSVDDRRADDRLSDGAKSSNEMKPKSGASVSRLAAAFANMLGTTSRASADDSSSEGDGSSEGSTYRPVENPGVTPRGIIEAMLFVGLPNERSAESRSNKAGDPSAGGAWIASEVIAGSMRDMSVEEVAEEIQTLNQYYERDGSPYRIDHSEAGYRMVLREPFYLLRDRFQSRARTAKLSPAALEVLSIVAYRQPISVAVIDELRDERSASALAQLVRRGLVERLEESPHELPLAVSLPVDSVTEGNKQADAAGGTAEDKGPWYHTTDRFLQLMQLKNVGQLPQVGEHDD